MMYAEYGARVKLDERYGYPTNGGTIVGYVERWDAAGDECETVWTVERDFDRQECNYVPEQFTVTMAPTQSAEDYLTRWDVDTALETLETVLDGGIPNRNLERYQAALIVAFYTLHVQEENRRWFAEGYTDYSHHRECVCAECDPVLWEDADGPAVDPDKYSHDEDWGADTVSGGWESGTCDDGYGYPVYRVED